MVNITKTFNNLFRPSHSKRDDGNNNKENQNGTNNNKQPKSNLRVNFQRSENRRHSYAPAAEMVDDDGASEVTLTSSEAERQQLIRHSWKSPYDVIPPPKLTRGPLSCPGGSSSGGTQHDDQQLLDRSLEARSEYQPPRHRRSERRVAGTVIGGGGGQYGGGSSPIRNGQERIRLSNQERDWKSRENVGYRNLQWTNNREPYGSVTVTERMLARLQVKYDEMKQRFADERARRRQLQQDLDQMLQANRKLAEENSHYKYLFFLHNQQQQQIAAGLGGFNGFPMYNLSMINATNSYMPSSWTADTPSSSSAVPVAASGNNKIGLDNTPRPWFANGAGTINTAAAAWTPRHHQQQQGLFLPSAAQQEMIAAAIAGSNPNMGMGGSASVTAAGGPGECLAQSLHSSSSLTQQNSLQYLLQFQAAQKQQQQQHQSCRPGSQDEVKNYRTGLHQQPNTDSFSESSRATTNQLNEIDQQLERDKHDLISDNSNEGGGIFESPEIPRSIPIVSNRNGQQQQKAMMNTTLLGGNYSFSANDCQMLLRDDGYATSETNMSTPGMMQPGKNIFDCIGTSVGGINNVFAVGDAAGQSSQQAILGTQGRGTENGNGNNKRRRRSMSVGQIKGML